MADFDFDNEDDVLAAMATELDIDESQLTIRASHMEAFGAGSVWQVSTRGGNKEWLVVEDDDVARELAIAVVTQDLEDEPEIFTQSWLEGFIDTDRLRRDLHSDVWSSNYDYWNELAESDPEQFWQGAEGYGADVPEEDLDDDDWEWPTPDDSVVETIAEKQTEEQLEDPIRYLEDIYGREDAVKQAMEIAGLDISAAADSAVDTDGAGHFLSGYDGELREGPHDTVYWRTN